jgi:hypothetical protein
MTFKKFSQLLMAPFLGCAFFPTTSVAALTNWDFDADNTHGWTTVQGEAFLRGDGVVAGQLDGEGGRAGDAAGAVVSTLPEALDMPMTVLIAL